MDILEEMTKEELIFWIKSQAHYICDPPKKSDILFSRYMAQSKKCSDMREKNIEHGASMELSKRDEYARQFNVSTDIQEKGDLAEKMKPYEEKLKKYLDESEHISKEEKKAEKLYEQYEIEIKRELTYAVP